jgi:hypothetical protein
MSAIVRICLLSLFASLAGAQDVPGVDTDLPQPFTAAVADQLVTQSPFTRIVNVEDTLQLTGVAYVDGRPVATFLNTATKERLTVSEQPNAQGWKITEAIPGNELQDTEVHVLIAGEEITMHYGNAQLTPGTSKKGAPGAYVARSGSGNARGDNPVKTSSFLGENGRELYVALSKDARDKLKEAVHAHVEKHPEQSQEQNSAYAQKMYAKIKAADQKSPSSSNPKNNIKSGKPGRKK